MRYFRPTFTRLAVANGSLAVFPVGPLSINVYSQSARHLPSYKAVEVIWSTMIADPDAARLHTACAASRSVRPRHSSDRGDDEDKDEDDNDDDYAGGNGGAAAAVDRRDGGDRDDAPYSRREILRFHSHVNEPIAFLFSRERHGNSAM